MSRDYLTIGSTPADEDCLQLGTPEYTAQAARAECQRFIDLIRAVCGEEPEGARLSVKGFPHDFGTYYEVVCYYDDDDERAADYAFHVEGDAPCRWSRFMGDDTGGKRWEGATDTDKAPPIHRPSILSEYMN